MKVVLALAVLCGLILTCESACNGNGCPISEKTCTGLRNQIACFITEKTGCTTSTENANFDTLITQLTNTTNARCGAGSITKASLPVLIVSLVAVYFKLK